ELSKGRLFVGDRRVPNFLIVELKSMGGTFMWDRKGMRTHLRNRYSRPVVDEEILNQSQIARTGEKFIRAAVFIRIVEPMLVLVLMFVVMTCPVLAQAPGGNIFGGSDQTVGNGVREAIRWARNILFLLGIGAVAWGTVNIFLEKPYARQF